MANLEKLADQLSELTLLEAAELKKMLEEKWGVTAAAPVAMAAMATSMAAPGPAAEVAAEATEFNVVLKDVGPKKIEVIKVVRTLTNLGLKEAKDMVEASPSTVLEGVPKEVAEDAKTKLEAASAGVEVKPA